MNSNNISNILKQVSKISSINPTIIGNVTNQLSKIAAVSPDIIEPLIIQLTKIAAVSPDIIEPLIIQLTKIFQNYKESSQSVLDSISDGQLLSKWWLIENVHHLDLGNIFLCGGWYAMLLFDNRLKFKQCINIDIDPKCEEISKILHKKLVIDNWKFQALNFDINNVNYKEFLFKVKRNNNTDCELIVKPDTIINTSCEHIEKFNDWWELIPKGKLIIVQSNNGFNLPGHINCVSNLKSFVKQTPMKKVLYSGEKEMPKFTRYMRIGIK